MSAATTFTRVAIGLSALALPLALTTQGFGGTGTKAGSLSAEEQIKTARTAAPVAISMNATIAVHEAGKMRVLHQGTNEWTCMPAMSEAPGPSPMCVDKNGMEWVHAWLERKDPPAEKMGIAYMLAGSSDASNTDPFATAPAAGKNWIKTGPHIMILGARQRLMEGLSAAAEPDTSKPFVMWAGTPYEHLMIPVE